VADSDHATAADAADDEPGPRHPEIGFRTRDRLEEHFKKHGRDFHVKTADEYLRLAQLLRDQPRSSYVLEIVRNDAVTCKFDRETGAFVAYNSDGTLRTFFRPRDGEAYFERQKTRTGEAP
jgi:pyocin large subunit-like protein